MNNRGQLGMGLMMGMIVALFVFMMMSAFLPAMVQMLGISKGNQGANCPGYIDPSATTALGGGNNNSYNSALSSDTITCSILNFTIGMYVLSIVFAVISGILTGKIYMSMGQEPQPSYGYQQY